ncbi:MAG: aminoacetone oxidase family FAD-binding enzyme [Verrucomicrobia bacterium]|nr:aminoacetone oxidase family FAD-binding enzyme [Verrucomicrobiota bacterium]MBU1735025.1 aminoacetone oxidase family FAD-binding enzyme [Verrucomicrobiota bacterium]MBU1856037.1 aminoacetone oxidase family FAD-binding enzyme [Verrucomicrobiota bacterium]
MSHAPNIPAVVIIGAGPAGLMAALTAARAGARVIVFEQLPEPGVRLLATGGGHCNFTNTLATEDFIRHFGAKSRFVAPAIKALNGNRLRLFFGEMGIPSHSPDGFHVFPVSDSARSIRDALRQACRKLGVEFRFNSRVDSLQIDRGQVMGIITSRGTESAAGVVLAAGGASYKSLGGGESGFRLARKAGHTIVPLCPALVPLVTRETWPATLAGVSLPRVTVSLACQDEAPARSLVCQDEAPARSLACQDEAPARSLAFQGNAREAATGSLLFTHQGISGPVVLDISGSVSSALRTRASVVVMLDLAPDRTIEAWQGHIERLRKGHGAKAVLSMLAESLPAALAKVVLDRVPITPPVARLRRPGSAGALRPGESATPRRGGYRDATLLSVARLSREQSRKLIMLIKNLPLTIVGTEGFGKAMVTKGGINLAEVCPKTLESKRVHGLFFAGEILDVDGPCGGFNLQWAFSSGFLATQNLSNQ